MTQPKRVSPLEWEVLEAVWAGADEVSVREVLEAAFPDGSKAYTTVQTVLNNLVNKGILSTRKVGLVNHYRAQFSRAALLERHAATFLERFFDGSSAAMASYLVEQGAMSADQLGELERLIHERAAESGQGGSGNEKAGSR